VNARATAEELASETFVRAFAARAGYDLAYPDITSGIVERIGQALRP
jgi:hypothetical protein